jgi:hypothetical protein
MFSLTVSFENLDRQCASALCCYKTLFAIWYKY